MRKLVLIFLFVVTYANITNVSAKEMILSDSKLPKVSLFYADMFDNICVIKTTYKIDQSWQNELNNELFHWRILWNDEGMVLLNETMKITGKPFPQQNFQVALSLCSFPSMSAPLIINARYALHCFTAHPIPDYVFISTIYHEILHNYIDSFLPKNTPLLVEYKNESTGVLNHLHLFALEKAVYLQLGWKSKLNAIIAKDESLPNKDYKRTWEIINKDETYNEFIVELKNI